MVRFLKPTKIKLVFLVEWGLFLAIELIRGELQGVHALLVACMPLVFFYLAACGLAVAAQKYSSITTFWKLLGLAFALVILDQISKSMVQTFIPYSTPEPVVKDWLNLTHVYNRHGSWLAATFDIHFVSTGLWLVLTGLISLGTVCGYRYYTSQYRQSVWTDVAFLGIFAGYLNWFTEMARRGYIVDYINLPDVVTADFKDILLAFGVAAFFAEELDIPQVSFRWKGWRQELEAFRQFAANLTCFSKEEIRRIKTMIRLL